MSSTKCDTRNTAKSCIILEFAVGRLEVCDLARNGLTQWVNQETAVTQFDIMALTPQ